MTLAKSTNKFIAHRGESLPGQPRCGFFRKHDDGSTNGLHGRTERADKAMDSRYATAISQHLSQGDGRQQLEGGGQCQVSGLHELADKRSALLRGCNLPFVEIQATIQNKGVIFVE